MRNLSKFLILLSTALVGPLWASPDGVEKTHLSKSGRGSLIYTSYCAACHGETGNGKGMMAGQLPVGSPVPADLSTWVFQGSRNDKRLRRAIRGGGSAVHKSSYMPAWASTLTDEQVDEVIAHVRDLKKGSAPSLASVRPLDDELTVGKALYSIRCLPCHGTNGEGRGFLLDSLVGSGSAPVDVLLPDFSLSSSVRNRSDDFFEAIISSGIDHSGLALQTSNGWWNRPLQVAELRALILYLRTLPKASPARR